MKKKTIKLDHPNVNQGESGNIDMESQYEKIGPVRKIKDKTGWEIRPENRMILKGDLTPADSGNTLLPDGIPQPKKGKK